MNDNNLNTFGGRVFNKQLAFPASDTDDVPSLYNSLLCDYVERLYPSKLERKAIAETINEVSFLDS